jgi:branched-chain amino acid transport system ATP-binding protein
VLNVQDIHTYYGHSYILQGVSLDVEKGAVVGILGRNGMGKTTLVRSIIGFTPPKRGKVIFNGQDLMQMRAYKVVRQGMNLVPQGRQIFPSLNVTENLMIGYDKSGEWGLERIYEVFPPLKARSRNSGSQLSGGEQQMLAIGRSLMTNPKLLLMDEPTEGLAPLYVQTVGETIDLLKNQGMSILLVEQNFKFAVTHTDFIHVLNKGQIVYSEAPDKFEQNQGIKSKYLRV